ncbi:ComEA family DNA-binding protein [Candidatus Neomarinimicrobiota bacterium]
MNIVSKEYFMKLPYIGEVKAERIIQLRNEMGTFFLIKDLEKVKGI